MTAAKETAVNYIDTKFEYKELTKILDDIDEVHRNKESNLYLVFDGPKDGQKFKYQYWQKKMTNIEQNVNETL